MVCSLAMYGMSMYVLHQTLVAVPLAILLLV